MTLQLNDLLGKLLTHKIHLQEESYDLPKKGVNLKVTKVDSDHQDQSSYEADEAMLMVTRQFKKFLRKQNLDYKKFSEGSLSKGKGDKFDPQISKVNVTYFTCGWSGHMMKDCPNLKKSTKTKKFKGKKVMVAT